MLAVVYNLLQVRNDRVWCSCGCTRRSGGGRRGGKGLRGKMGYETGEEGVQEKALCKIACDLIL